MIHKIEHFKVDKLHKHPSNPRTLKDTAYNTLKESIEANPELLEARPLILSNRTGKNIVIGGNQRLQVVKDLGWMNVPCVLFPDMSEEKEREIMIRDNVSNGDWDWDKLANEWDSDLLNEWGLAVPDWEQEQEEYEGQTDQDAAPELEPEAVTQLGDLWLLGEHRLLCGDSTDQATVEFLMNGQKADMVFTDPPYGVDYSSQSATMYYGNGKKGKPREKILGDVGPSIYFDLMPVLASICDGPMYIFCGAGKEIDALISIRDNGVELINTLIWDKQRFGGHALNANYKPCFELFYYCMKKNGQRRWSGPNNEETIWRLSRDNKTDLHPTQKPVSLAEKAIRNHDAAIVLDLFGGSGSTLIACEKTSRQARLMELDPKYCDVIIKRWQDFSGKQATLEATGETFEEVKHGRTP